MATTSESTASFLQGLSDLWIRFFADKAQLEALYAGTEVTIGQAYLEILENVLNLSVRETSLFRKEYFKLLTVREDLVALRLEDGYYGFEMTDLNIRSFKFLYNKVFAPSVVLEQNVHFDIVNDAEDTLVFYQNPFDWDGDGSGTIIPGVAYRTVEVQANDGTISTQRELAFWIPDAQVDAYDLYLTYGYLLNRFEPSSEAYRALLRGVMRYFVLGPTPNILTSALNVILGFPVIRNVAEVLQTVDFSDPNYTIVRTDKANYQFDVSIPIRDDILDATNWGVLSFQAFEHLTKVFAVYDAVNNPVWYYDTLISTQLLPDEPRARRDIKPELYENLVDNPPGLVRIGDPGFIVGRDDDGGYIDESVYPPVPYARTATYRHNFAYIVFERFLRHHTFAVVIDPLVVFGGAIPFPRLLEDLRGIIIPGKSAYTFLIAEPALELTENWRPFDDSVLSMVAGMRVGTETISSSGENLAISGDWDIGDYYKLEAGGIVVYPGPPVVPFAGGEVPLSVGGASPFTTPTVPSIADLGISITVV